MYINIFCKICFYKYAFGSMNNSVLRIMSSC